MCWGIKASRKLRVPQAFQIPCELGEWGFSSRVRAAGKSHALAVHRKLFIFVKTIIITIIITQPSLHITTITRTSARARGNSHCSVDRNGGSHGGDNDHIAGDHEQADAAGSGDEGNGGPYGDNSIGHDDDDEEDGKLPAIFVALCLPRRMIPHITRTMKLLLTLLTFDLYRLT